MDFSEAATGGVLWKNVKLYGKFGNTSQVMQNPKPKLRQGLLFSGLSVGKIENFDELQLP